MGFGFDFIRKSGNAGFVINKLTEHDQKAGSLSSIYNSLSYKAGSLSSVSNLLSFKAGLLSCNPNLLWEEAIGSSAGGNGG